MNLIPFPTLCLVTNRTINREMNFEDAIESAVNGGIDIVQLREKDLPPEDLLVLASRLRKITLGKAKLFVNGNLEVALKAGADGIHLPQESIPVSEVRRSVPDDFIIGKSAHDNESAVSAAREGVDYILLGTIFPTDSKPDAETGGIDRIRNACAKVKCPVLAIGGINPENIKSVIAAGAHGAAVSGAILTARDPKFAAIQLRSNCHNLV